MAPASPSHARPGRTRWERTLAAGQEALLTSSEAIAAQVDVVAERMMTALELRHADRVAARASSGEPGPAWELDEVEVTFGVQLTGEASIAVFSAGSESSAEIVLHFSRTGRTTP